MGKRKSARKSPLVIRITLVVLAVFVAGQSVLWIWFLQTQKAERQSALRERVASDARLLGELLGRSMKDRDLDAVERYVKLVVAGDDVLSIKVIDHDGKHIVHVVRNVDDRPASLNPFYIPWSNRHVESVIVDKMSHGLIEIVYGGAGVNRAMFRLLVVPAIAQAIVFVCIVISIYWFIQRRVGIPIARLRECIGKVTTGDLTVRMPEFEDQELMTISEGLEFLVKGLTATVHRMNGTASIVSDTMVRLDGVLAETMKRMRGQMASTDHIAGSIKRADATQETITQGTERLAELTRENAASLEEFKASEAEIKSGMETLFASTDNSYAIVVGMTETTKVMNDDVQQVLSSVENTSASVEEIIASVREVETSARESSRLAESVRTVAAQQGMATMDRAVKGMDQIRARVEHSVSIVGGLGARSQDIERILSVIREVTEQTNMLSINASILAEQAGEHGKGFYIVANEMRQLSDRTARSTKEIAHIVGVIQRGIEEAVTSIEKGMKMVSEGSSAVYDMGDAMSTILESAHNSAHMTKMIERATEDQVTALRHIETSVIDVNTMALEMSRAMENLHGSTGAIMERVGEVKGASEVTKRSTVELESGVRAIASNLDHAFQQVDVISESVRAQQKQTREVVDEIESIRTHGNRVMHDMESLSEAIRRLREDVDSLRREMGAFRT